MTTFIGRSSYARFAATCALWGMAWCGGAGNAGADEFAAENGDLVLLLGNTFIERAQESEYLETALTAALGNRDLRFRNLGWSGDTVYGDARSYFGPAAEGFERLQKQVRELKPAIILVCYGAMAAFEGATGLQEFITGYRSLLNMLEAESGARKVILVSPPPVENLGPPLPDLSAQNDRLADYREAIEVLAAERGCGFLDLFELLGGSAGTGGVPEHPLTENGVHYLPEGYRKVARRMLSALGLEPDPWRIVIDAANGAVDVSEGARISMLEASANSVRFSAEDRALPFPPATDAVDASGDDARVFQVKGLAPGRYLLRIDGEPVAADSANAWSRGKRLSQSPAFDQVEELRRAIKEKNRLYFLRWRPANETYLFGFRAHEQGQNAKEVPMFDPIIVEKEAVIRTLKKPRIHTYELAPE